MPADIRIAQRRLVIGPRYGLWLLTPRWSISYWAPWSWVPLSMREAHRRRRFGTLEITDAR